MTKLTVTTILVAMMLVAFGAPCIEADRETDRATLKGMTAVSVLVATLPNGAKKLGLAEDTIRTDVELKLRLAGLRVVSQEEQLKPPIGPSPSLYVQINMTDNTLAANVDLELRQIAILASTREPAVVSTWSTAIIGYNPTNQELRNVVRDQTDIFVNAWLSVNPKK
jgi:hypothetical protein